MELYSDDFDVDEFFGADCNESYYVAQNLLNDIQALKDEIERLRVAGDKKFYELNQAGYVIGDLNEIIEKLRSENELLKRQSHGSIESRVRPSGKHCGEIEAAGQDDCSNYSSHLAGKLAVAAVTPESIHPDTKK